MATPLSPGDVLAGKYVVERSLGRGGSGFVIAARHAVLKQRVAIKLLHDEVAIVPEVGARFLREAQAAARLTSPHAVRIMDADRLETGRPYIVMEYLEGRDLNEVAKQEGPLPPAIAARYVAQACDAIAEAHALGVVHRDVKPSNLFLTSDRTGAPLVKVVDFGISKVLEPPDEAPEIVTHSCQVIGSVRFMSPEQMRSTRDVDHRTDIWSLGVTLFVLATGRFPFRGTGLVELSTAIHQGPPPTMGPDAPAALDAIVRRCLSVEPSSRYASATDLRRELLRFAETTPDVAAMPRVAVPLTSPSTPLAAAPVVVERGGSAREERRPALRRFAPLTIAVAAALLFGAFRIAPGFSHRADVERPPVVARATVAEPLPRVPEPVPVSNQPEPAIAAATTTAAATKVPAAAPTASSRPRIASKLPARSPSPASRSPSPASARETGTKDDFDVIRNLPH